MTGSSTVLRLGYFSASPVLALAEQRGLLEEQGLRIRSEAVASSPGQFRSLLAGDYDVVLTSPDNVSAYRFGSANPLGEQADVRIIHAVDGGMGLSVIAGAGITEARQLRGRTVAVDVPSSGFAFALYHLLAEHGVRRADYSLVSLGSTPRRAVALREGTCDATLLNGAATVAAELDGLNSLGRVSATVRPYLGTVLAATGPWLDAHPEVARRLCLAWQQATSALLDDAESPSTAALLARAYDLPDRHVPLLQRTLADPGEGLVRDGAIDQAALRSVLDLRARYADAQAAADVRNALRAGVPASGIVDERFAVLRR